MAVTSRNFGAQLTAAADTISGTVGVRKMYLRTAGTAGDYVWKNGDGDILCTMYGEADSMRDIDCPFGERSVQGLELDALPSGGEVDIIYF